MMAPMRLEVYCSRCRSSCWSSGPGSVVACDVRLSPSDRVYLRRVEPDAPLDVLYDIDFPLGSIQIASDSLRDVEGAPFGPREPEGFRVVWILLHALHNRSSLSQILSAF